MIGKPFSFASSFAKTTEDKKATEDKLASRQFRMRNGIIRVEDILLVPKERIARVIFLGTANKG